MLSSAPVCTVSPLPPSQPECPALLEKQLWGKGALCTYAAADARLPRLVLRVGDPRPGTGRCDVT